jgi:hypothetical protein
MRLRLIAVVVSVGLSACGEATPPIVHEPGWIKLVGTTSFEASGSPAFEGQTIVPSTFAVAIADSVAGAFILAFNKKSGDRGDFFVLALDARRAGTFRPCGERARIDYPDGSTLTLPGPCSGHLTEDVVVFDGLVSSAAGYRQIMGGTVIVEDADRRLIGSVMNLRLEGFGAGSGASGSVLITEGRFDLPLLTGAAAERMMYCFVEDALGKRCQM